MLRNVDSHLLADIKEKTGAHAVAIVLVDSVLPCPDVRANGVCENEHHWGALTDGVDSKEAVGAMFNFAWHQLDDHGNVQE